MIRGDPALAISPTTRGCISFRVSVAGGAGGAEIGSRRATSSLSACRKLAAVFASSATSGRGEKRQKGERRRGQEGAKETALEWHSW